MGILTLKEYAFILNVLITGLWLMTSSGTALLKINNK